KGNAAPSVPGSCFASTAVNGRTQSDASPDDEPCATYAIFWPSGESAKAPLNVAFSGAAIAKRIVWLWGTSRLKYIAPSAKVEIRNTAAAAQAARPSHLFPPSSAVSLNALAAMVNPDPEELVGEA